MPVRAPGPRPHPNAADADRPALGPPPPPPPKPRVMSFPVSSLASEEMHMCRFVLNRLYSVQEQLKRVISHLRILMRQYETAWVALRGLYNHATVVYHLIHRTHAMYMFLPHIEDIARGVNVFPGMPADTDDGAADDRHSAGSRIPPASPGHGAKDAAVRWGIRCAPKFERVLASMSSYLGDLDLSCFHTIRRRGSTLMLDPDAPEVAWGYGFIDFTISKMVVTQQQIESHLISCKYIHMVQLKSLCADNSGQTNEAAKDMNSIGRDLKGQPAFFTFWDGLGQANVVRSAERTQRKKRSSRSSAARDKKGKKPADADGAQGESSAAQPASSIEDLLSAMRRSDYLTVGTMLMSDMDLNGMLEDGTYVLSHAVDDDNAALVSVLAVCGARPNVHHRAGSTPLHFASNANCIASALILLEAGADADIRDAQGLTPLHVACRERHISIIIQLLAHGADPNAYDDRGITPLGYALLHPSKPISRREIITILLTYGARATGRGHVISPVAEAILQYDQYHLVSQYLGACPSLVEAETIVATTGSDDRGMVRIRPLYAAILVGNIFCMNMLMRHDADVHHVTAAYGKTVGYLALAVQAHSAPLVARLLLAGADANAANSDGQTPLHFAAGSQRCDIEVTNLLLKHGADCLAKTKQNHIQPLHVAVVSGRADICTQLIDRGADVEQPLISGVSPAMLAVYAGKRMLLRFLVSKGADILYKTPTYGETAMHAACRVGDITMAAYLLEQGLSVDACYPFPLSDIDGDGDSDTSSRSGETTTAVDRGCRGYAPIHMAASRGQVKVVRWLLENGADAEARIGRIASRMCLFKDSDSIYHDEEALRADATDVGQTPAQIARSFGHDTVATLIEDHIAQLASEASQSSGSPPSAAPSTSAASPHSDTAPAQSRKTTSRLLSKNYVSSGQPSSPTYESDACYYSVEE